MTNEEILEKAISKAVENGWKPVVAFHTGTPFSSIELWFVMTRHDIKDFAKALWGEEQFVFYGKHYDLVHADTVVRAGGGLEEEWYEHPVWKWHLQQMVIADDPIKYLGENI